jgi:hypothetical protein
MGNRKTHGNTMSQKVNNHKTKDVMNSERDETSVSKLKRMMIRIIMNFKGSMQKQVNKNKTIWIISHRSN